MQQQNCAPYCAPKQAFLVRKDSVRSSVRSKTGFLVRKEMVRKEVRSKTALFMVRQNY